MEKITVFFVDDHEDYRWVMKHFLTRHGISVLEIFTHDFFIQQAKFEAMPDIAIISSDSNQTSTDRSIAFIQKDHPTIKILVNSSHEDHSSIKSIVEKGVEGWVSKYHKDPEQIIKALQALNKNQKFFGNTIVP